MSELMLRVLAAVLFLLPAPARAADVALNAGAIEVVSTDGDHFGVYPYAGASLIVPTSLVTLIPSVTVEWSPEFDRWGFVGALIGDVAVGDRLGVDAMVVFLHDQAGTEWGEAAYYLGFGAGASVFVDRLTISPSVGIYRGLNVDGWYLVPLLNVAWTL